MKLSLQEPRRVGRGHSASGIASHEIDWRNPSDDDIVAFTESQVKQHDERHLGWIRQSAVQLAWAAGSQLTRWDDATRTLQDTYEVEAERIALFVNRIKPAVLNWISLITSRPVSFRVHPSTAEDNDVASSHVQDKLVRYYWKKLLGDKKFVDALWMMFCTGCVFLKSSWDPLQGQLTRLAASDIATEPEIEEAPGNGYRAKFAGMIGRLIGSENGDDIKLDKDDKYTVGEGDLECELLTGFEIIPPYRATNIQEDCKWLIVRTYQHIEDLRDRYGAKAKDLSPQLIEPFYDFRGYGADEYSHAGLQGHRQAFQSNDHVLIHELWRPTTKNVRKGFYAVVSQGKILRKGPNPYEHGEIPIVMLQELPSPKQFWPPSTVTDMMSIQMEINITASQVAEHKALTIQPHIITERGSGLDELAFTRRGSIEEVNPGFIDRVKPWTPEPLPVYLPWLDGRLRSDFEDVSRNHAPSYGKQKSSVKSGKHAVALQEADARLNTTMMRLLQDSMSHVCRQWLSILHQYADEERVVTLIGENNEPEVIKWSNELIPDAPYNVTTEIGPSMDRATTIELIDTLTARGWLSPERPEDRSQVFRWLGEGMGQEIDESRTDRRNAIMENEALLAGEIVPVSEGDDDTTHLEEHGKEQKSARFRKVAAANPQVEETFKVHTRNHERQRLRKMIRPKVYAQEIEMELMAQAGLLPSPEQLAAQQEAEGGGNGQRKPQQSASRPGTAQPKQGERKQRPQRASRRQSAPGGFEQRASGLLVPQ